LWTQLVKWFSTDPKIFSKASWGFGRVRLSFIRVVSIDPPEPAWLNLLFMKSGRVFLRTPEEHVHFKFYFKLCIQCDIEFDRLWLKYNECLNQSLTVMFEIETGFAWIKFYDLRTIFKLLQGCTEISINGNRNGNYFLTEMESKNGIYVEMDFRNRNRNCPTRMEFEWEVGIIFECKLWLSWQNVNVRMSELFSLQFSALLTVCSQIPQAWLGPRLVVSSSFSAISPLQLTWGGYFRTASS